MYLGPVATLWSKNRQGRRTRCDQESYCRRVMTPLDLETTIYTMAPLKHKRHPIALERSIEIIEDPKPPDPVPTTQIQLPTSPEVTAYAVDLLPRQSRTTQGQGRILRYPGTQPRLIQSKDEMREIRVITHRGQGTMSLG